MLLPSEPGTCPWPFRDSPEPPLLPFQPEVEGALVGVLTGAEEGNAGVELGKAEPDLGPVPIDAGALQGHLGLFDLSLKVRGRGPTQELVVATAALKVGAEVVIGLPLVLSGDGPQVALHHPLRQVRGQEVLAPAARHQGDGYASCQQRYRAGRRPEEP